MDFDLPIIDWFNRKALKNANNRIAQLETELAAAKSQPPTAIGGAITPTTTGNSTTSQRHALYPRKSWRSKRAAKEAELNQAARGRKRMAEDLESIQRQVAEQAQIGESNVHS